MTHETGRLAFTTLGLVNMLRVVHARHGCPLAPLMPWHGGRRRLSGAMSPLEYRRFCAQVRAQVRARLAEAAHV